MRKSAVLLALILSAAAVFTELFLYSHNTLLENDSWRSRKRDMQMLVMGSNSFLTTRAALAGNALNLGTWFGYNELQFSKPLTLAEATVNFRLSERAALAILFNREPESFSGLRVSANSSLPSLFFRAKTDGEFVQTRRTDLETVEPGPHELTIKFDENGAKAWLDGRGFGELPEISLQKGGFGLRSWLEPVTITRVTLKTQTGELFEESFRNSRGWWKVLLSLVLFFGVISALYFEVAKIRGTVTRAFFGCSALLGVVLLTGTLLLAFDFFYWSHLQVDPRAAPLKPADPLFVQKPEALRRDAADFWASIYMYPVANRERLMMRGYPFGNIFERILVCREGACKLLTEEKVQALIGQPERGTSPVRVVFVGTSQLAGAGAAAPDETVMAHVYRELSKSIKGLELYNLSINGGNTGELFERYKSRFTSLRPRAMIFVLGVNDAHVETFPESLRSFLDYNEKAGVESILALEPTSFERPKGTYLLEAYKVIESEAKTRGARVGRLNDYMVEPDVRDKGLIWWDFVHLTSYGQKLLAQQLTPLISPPLLRPRR
ncbi:MAG TPA: SGNH/GDSL hydrolase family protein [Bdellovibrionales bacterium]|nr:SGNH/GDSL hydrolase family protein [Bdellovibrionales bacterium]